MAHTRIPSVILALFIAATIFGLVPVAQGQRLVFPGETIDFRDPALNRVVPDVIDGETDSISDALIGTNPGIVPLSSFVRANRVLGRAYTSIYQYNSIMLDTGDGSETVVSAQVSGTVNIRGFLLQVGWGRASADVTFDVIDVTFGETDPPNVVATHSIAAYELAPDLSAGIEVALGAKIGSATAAVAGGDFGVGLEFPLSLRVVRDEIPFGFPVLLQRGHVYRLQLKNESAVKLGRGAGSSIASFYNPAAAVPPIFGNSGIIFTPPTLHDPSTWVTNLSLPILDRALPAWTFPSGGLIDWFTDFEDTNDVLDSFGIPSTPRGIIGDFMDQVAPDEELTAPGVELTRLQVMVAQDHVALLNEISEQVEELKVIAMRKPFPWPPQAPASPKQKTKTERSLPRR